MQEKAVLALSLLLCLSLVVPVSSWAQERWHNPAEGGDRSGSAILYQKARKAFANEDYTTCINLLRKAIHLDQSNKELYHLCALAMAQSGDNYNANMMFRAALTCDYNFTKCRNNYGVFLRKMGRLDEAKQALKETIKIDPNYPDPYYHLGEVLQQQGDLDGAIEEYQNAVRLNPNYFEAQRDLGLAIYEQVSAGVNEISESLERLRIAAKLAPQNPMIHYHLGNIYCADCKLDDAETAFRTALTCDPKLAAAHFELGKLRYYRGDLDRCLLEMQAALKINPVYTDSNKYPKVDIIKAQEFLAKCNEYKDRLADSIESWKQVASMQKDQTATLKHVNELVKQIRAEKRSKTSFDPEEVNALLIKGIDEAESGEIEQAKSTFAHVLQLNPESFEANQNLGLLAEATGDLNGAMEQYKKGMALLPKFDGVYYNMAYLLEKLSLPADAGLMYQRFHEIAGRYPYDSKHIVALQQEDARRRAKEQEIRQRGY
jgi:tetratricopeptide (TPR) repeat protein